MINTYLTQSFKSFSIQEIHKKNSTNKVGFFALNKSDHFSRINNKIEISFTGSSFDPYKELNNLKHKYLNLSFAKDQKLEYFLKDSDGLLFVKYLLEGKNPEEILSNHINEFSNPKHLNKLLKSNILEEPATAVFKKYKEFLIYRNKLLEKIHNIEQQYKLVGKAENQDLSSLRYADHVVMTTPLGYNPNHSECFRYQDLYLPFKTMIEEHLDKLQELPNSLSNNKVKILVVGLGKESEEVYDYATYAYKSIKGRGLELSEVLDFDFVDLRSQENFLKSCVNIPKIDRLSFSELPANIQSRLKEYTETYFHYSYNYDVLDFVYKSLRQKDKAHFNCPIEDYIQGYKGNGYDFVSINNVLQYLGVPEGTTQNQIDKLDTKHRYHNPLRFKTDEDNGQFDGFKIQLKRIASMVKPGGLLSCKIGKDKSIEKKLNRQLFLAGIKNDFDQITTGLYRKKINKI